jgi:hypothetical protein
MRAYDGDGVKTWTNEEEERRFLFKEWSLWQKHERGGKKKKKERRSKGNEKKKKVVSEPILIGPPGRPFYQLIGQCVISPENFFFFPV